MVRKSYRELIKLKTFEDRFEYLKIGDKTIGEDTFGGHRYLNQNLYRSPEWRRIRDAVIVRDLGRDLGLEGYEIADGQKIIVHHINPLTLEEILNMDPCVFDMENLITTVDSTHNALHYGSIGTINVYTERYPGDTKLW